MALQYSVIVVFTGEEVRCGRQPLHVALIEKVRSFKIAARCLVTRGIAGGYENGETATGAIEVLSYNMPLRIEIVLPSADLPRVLSAVEEMVVDGIVAVEALEVHSHRTTKRLIPRQIRVWDECTAPVRTVGLATPVTDIIRLLLSAGFHGVPVVDAEERPVGIVTQGDLIRRAGMPVRLGLLAEFEGAEVGRLLAALPPKTAADVMSQPVVTVAADQTLAGAVDLMLRHNLKRLPVTGEGGRLVGILARADVFHAISRETPDWRALQGGAVAVASARCVRDIMRRDTHEVAPDTPIDTILRVIDENDIQRVAVVDARRRLLGLISDRSLLAAFAGHRAGVWDYLVGRLSSSEFGQRHKELSDYARARTARDVMKTDLVTVREETPVEEAVRLMIEHEIKRLPVVDADGTFKGMVSRDALLRAGA